MEWGHSIFPWRKKTERHATEMGNFLNFGHKSNPPS